MTDSEWLSKIHKKKQRGNKIAKIITTISILILLGLIITLIYYNNNYMYKCYDIDNNIYYCNFMNGCLSKMQLRLPDGKWVQLKSFELIRKE